MARVPPHGHSRPAGPAGADPEQVDELPQHPHRSNTVRSASRSLSVDASNHRGRRRRISAVDEQRELEERPSKRTPTLLRHRQGRRDRANTEPCSSHRAAIAERRRVDRYPAASHRRHPVMMRYSSLLALSPHLVNATPSSADHRSRWSRARKHEGGCSSRSRVRHDQRQSRSRTTSGGDRRVARRQRRDRRRRGKMTATDSWIICREGRRTPTAAGSPGQPPS